MSSTAPCHMSDARAREFNKLSNLLRQSFDGCGFDHAVGVAIGYEHDFGHEAAVLLREACCIPHAVAAEAIVRARGRL